LGEKGRLSPPAICEGPPSSPWSAGWP